MSIYPQLSHHDLRPEPFKEAGDYLCKGLLIFVISCIHGHGYVHTVSHTGAYADLVNKTGARK